MTLSVPCGKGDGNFIKQVFSELKNWKEKHRAIYPRGFPGGWVIKNPPVNAGNVVTKSQTQLSDLNKQTKISSLSNEIYIDIKWAVHHNKGVLCLVAVLSDSAASWPVALQGFSIHGSSSGKNTGVGWKCPPEDLPNAGIKLRTPAFQADSLPAELPGEPHNKDRWHKTSK